MRTENQIKQMIDSLVSESIEVKNNSELTSKDKKKQIKKITQRVVYLRECLLYLETNPRVEFIQNQLDKYTSLLQIKQSQVKELLMSLGTLIGRNKKEKELGIPELKRKINNLKFILNQ